MPGIAEPDLHHLSHDLVAQAMTQNPISVGIGQHNGVRIVGILPIDPSSTQWDPAQESDADS